MGITIVGILSGALALVGAACVVGSDIQKKKWWSVWLGSFVCLFVFSASGSILWESGYEHGEGNLCFADCLNKKMIYQVLGEMKIPGKVEMAVALANAEGKIVYVISEPLPAGTSFVRVKGIALEPVTLPAEPNTVKPVLKEQAFLLVIYFFHMVKYYYHFKSGFPLSRE